MDGKAESGRFEPLELKAADGTVLRFCRHGGQLLSWVAGGREQLFLSSRAEFREDAAIRGGVPVIFPQFAAFGPLPKHGFARQAPWHLAASHAGASGVWAELHLSSLQHVERSFPYDYELCLRLAADATTLELDLSVLNPGAAGFSFTAALHGYFALADLAAASLEGLEGCAYRDCVAGGEAVEREARLAFRGELDRIYRSAGPLLLRDGDRRLRFSAEGFDETVIWNPGPDKGRQLADLGEGEWRHFVCVEAARVSAPICLAPGQRWLGRQRIQRVV